MISIYRARNRDHNDCYIDLTYTLDEAHNRVVTYEVAGDSNNENTLQCCLMSRSTSKIARIAKIGIPVQFRVGGGSVNIVSERTGRMREFDFWVKPPTKRIVCFINKTIIYCTAYGHATVNHNIPRSTAAVAVAAVGGTRALGRPDINYVHLPN